MGRRSALDGEQAGYGGGLLGIGGQPVHGLRGHDGEAAGHDARDDALDVLGDELAGGHSPSVRPRPPLTHRSVCCHRSVSATCPSKHSDEVGRGPEQGWGSGVAWIGHAHAPSRPRFRPDLRRRVHGSEPLGRRVASRCRPHDDRRDRHDAAGGRRQHDRRGRSADGRDGGPPRRVDRAAPGHPARRRRVGRRLRQEPPPAVRDGDHAVSAPHDRRRAGADPQAGPRRRRCRRRRWGTARCVRRARCGRLRPLHPTSRRRQPRARHLRRWNRRRDGVREADRAASTPRPCRRRRGATDRRRHPQRCVALDDLPAGRRRRGPVDARRRRRDQR